jgi:hypothetical protein
VPWPAIWGGKWLAAVVLVPSTAVLPLIPWMLVYSPERGGSWLPAIADSPWGFFAVLLFLGIGFANLNATLYRSRSAWLVFDFALLLLSLWATRRYVAPLWLYGALAPLKSPVVALLPVALGLLAGSVAQVAIGRTDVRRAHRALSLGFWAVVALTLATAAGGWAWVRSAGPAEVHVHTVTPDPRGRWVYVEGSRHRYAGWCPHGFLIDASSGRYAVRPEPRLDRSELPLGLLFSADGRFAALPQSDGRGAALALYDLTGATPSLTEVALQSSHPDVDDGLVSPSATSVFLVHESGASLFALPSGRRVATTTIGPGWRPAVLRFLAEGEARAWLVHSNEARARVEMRVVDLSTDGQSRALTFPIARAFDPAAGWRGVFPDTGGRRILTLEGGLHLRDGATGEVIATLAEGEGRLSTLFLADGRIVVAGGLDGSPASRPQTSVQVFDTAGVKLGEARLDLWPWGLSVGPEVTPGRVAVSSFRSPYLAEDTLVVDVGAGRVVERISGLRPAGLLLERLRRARRCGPDERALLPRRRGPGHPHRLRERRANGRRRTRRAARRADQRALSDWIITSRARPEASRSSATSGSVSRRNAPSIDARRRGASPATRTGGRIPPRTITCEAARRETRPFASSNGRISTRRAKATAAA